MRHQVLELLLAHQIQRGPVPVDSANDMLWDEHGLMYPSWAGSQGLPGRSASFSGIIGHRDMTPPPQKYFTKDFFIFILNVATLVYSSLNTFLYWQQLVDGWSAISFPAELAAAANQPISNSAGPSKSHGPLPSAHQHLTGGDFRRRGS